MRQAEPLPASGGFWRRLRRSFPSRAETVYGAPLWGAAMSLSALLALCLRIRTETFNLDIILVLFFAGGLIAWPLSLLTARLVANGRGLETRLAAAFLILTLCTVMVTAGLFALQYRLFYAQWHAPFGTVTWMFQFVFTSASAVYQFLVMGLGLYLPLGFVVLAGTSLWLARRI
ncbi:hypothetical protein [Pararhizobium sp.]|uniref:hypothetical protein n=1 Tax=Pararhizobium sp. TaxID=1977563 RepID=UPI00271DC7EB|nr:hypothetical protein [Pararhizobium sp.]MDO9417132.1 hypothetical protein [Pararhizobium sp.]